MRRLWGANNRRPESRRRSSKLEGAAAPNSDGGWPVYTLRAEQSWQLNLPKKERFDASGLALTRTGELLTMSDRGASVYRIHFQPESPAADLIELPNCFTPAQLQPFAREKLDRYDCEGIALDPQQRIYLCEEANRWVLRCDPDKAQVERLAIDWTPVEKLLRRGRCQCFF